jgi:hypothetical protein
VATRHIVVSKVVVSFPETVDFGALGGVLLGVDYTAVLTGAGQWYSWQSWRVFTQGPHVFDVQEGLGEGVCGYRVCIARGSTAPTVIKTRFNVIAAGVNSTATGNLTL